MTITLENLLNELSPQRREAVEKRGEELIQELRSFENAIDFFITHLDGKTSEADRNYLLENPPTLNELSAAIYVAVHGGASLEESFENALVIIRHWGILETLPGKTELSYDGAIRMLAVEEWLAEEMKKERAPVDTVISTVGIWLDSGKSKYDVIEAGLRVLYEYHLWGTSETKNEHAEMEGDSEGS